MQAINFIYVRALLKLIKLDDDKQFMRISVDEICHCQYCQEELADASYEFGLAWHSFFSAN